MTNDERVKLVIALTQCDGILSEDGEEKEIGSPRFFRVIGARPNRRRANSARIWRDGHVVDMDGETLVDLDLKEVDQKLIILSEQKINQLTLAMQVTP